MKIITVTENEAGQRLDKLLQKYLNEAGKGFIYKMLRKKNITLNGKKADGSEKLVCNDEIKLFLSDETIEKFSSVEITKASTNLDIIYEDNNIMILNKPAGMLSQKAKESDISMVEYIINYLLDSNQMTKEQLRSFKPSVCNRLDRNTSGIIVAGKSLLGLQEMSKLLKERTMHKYYYCIVNGRLDKRCHLKGYLVKNEKTNKVEIQKERRGMDNEQWIETEYTPLATNGKVTLLKVLLITGRSHQIRAHLSSIGHSLIGDMKYGNKQANDYFYKTCNINRQMLHSYELEMPKLEGGLYYLSGKIFIASLSIYFKKLMEKEGLVV